MSPQEFAILMVASYNAVNKVGVSRNEGSTECNHEAGYCRWAHVPVV